jgi:hypothetical protein
VPRGGRQLGEHSLDLRAPAFRLLDDPLRLGAGRLAGPARVLVGLLAHLLRVLVRGAPDWCDAASAWERSSAHSSSVWARSSSDSFSVVSRIWACGRRRKFDPICSPQGGAKARSDRPTRDDARQARKNGGKLGP